MKLETLHEAAHTSRLPSLQRAMKILQSVKPDANLENLAWYAAHTEADILSDFNHGDRAHMFFHGLPPLKDPNILDNHFKIEFSWEDDDFGEEEVNKMLAKRFKDFF